MREKKGGRREEESFQVGKKSLVPFPVSSALFLNRGEHPAAGAEPSVSKHPGGRRSHSTVTLQVFSPPFNGTDRSQGKVLSS